jgi:hypothetical protein
MRTLLIIIVILLLFGGGGGYYGYSHWGPVGGGGFVGVALLVILILISNAQVVDAFMSVGDEPPTKPSGPQRRQHRQCLEQCRFHSLSSRFDLSSLCRGFHISSLQY